MGLSYFFLHICDWDEIIIRQFYATLQIDMVEETLAWMTGKRIYHTIFAEFATANLLNYDFLKDEQSVNMVMENLLDENDYSVYYEPACLGIHRVFGDYPNITTNKVMTNIFKKFVRTPSQAHKQLSISTQQIKSMPHKNKIK